MATDGGDVLGDGVRHGAQTSGAAARSAHGGPRHRRRVHRPRHPGDAAVPQVFEHAARTGIAITPHLLQPMPRDGRTPDEAVLIMHAGMSPSASSASVPPPSPMLDWWHERMRTDVVVDLQHALFTDQRWIDWVPSLYAHTIERDPGLNVAYSEHPRTAAHGDRGMAGAAAGVPLRFFHFSGFDPAVPWRLSKHAGPRPRGLLSADPVLARLLLPRISPCSTSRASAVAPAPTDSTWAADGTALHPLVRTAFRRAWMSAAAGDGSPPPDRFVSRLDATTTLVVAHHQCYSVLPMPPSARGNLAST